VDGLATLQALSWLARDDDFRGTPTGIDVRLALQTGILPQINTGIAHRLPGIGQIGAGLVNPPLACFEAAGRARAAELTRVDAGTPSLKGHS
jgi:hypothetical protein